ncbi:MAG: glycosyltransferase family 4 protein [Ignavibacteriales bacterium]|nr:glycosyltransferase family 4 protein [Ignavibacteriales bacterium]
MNKAIPTKVLLMIDEASIGGGQQHVLALAENIKREEYEVAVACERSGYLVDELRKRKISVLPISISNTLSVRSLLSCVQAIRQYSPAIVHTHGGTAGFYGRIAARIVGGIRTVHTYHGLHYLHAKSNSITFLHRWIDRLLLPMTNSLICVAQADYDLGVAKKVVHPSKGVVIYNGIAVERYKASVLSAKGLLEQKTKNDTFIVGTIGRLHIQKGHKFFLVAAKQILEEYPNTLFYIVGEGILRQELEAQSRTLGIAENVKFLGARTDIPQQLARMDVFVLPSLWEGLPLVLLEAMAARKPIVATAVNGVLEILEDRKEGMLVPPKDPESLAKAVLLLRRDPALASALESAAYTKVSTRFNVQTMTRSTEKVYEKVLNIK